MADEIIISRDLIGEGVLRLTLNRPERRNAMSMGLVTALEDALRRAESDGDARAIVLDGAGGGFCAGSDLSGLGTMDDGARRDFEAASGRLARALLIHPLPVVAAVAGFAIGGGLTLAAACDIVVTTAAAKWSLPEVPIGLFPAWGLQPVIDRIGIPAARRLSWGIDTHDGTAAQALGLADVLADDPLAEAVAVATRLAALPAGPSRAVKTYFADEALHAAGDARANRHFMDATRTPEGRATLAKFAAKAG